MGTILLKTDETLFFISYFSIIIDLIVAKFSTDKF